MKRLPTENDGNTADLTELSFDEFDERRSPRSETTGFALVAQRAMSRRDFMEQAVTFGLAGFLTGAGGVAAFAKSTADPFGFGGVAANGLDTVTVPQGFRWQTVATWGDPLWSTGEAFDDAARGSAASQRQAFGDNNDGMSLFEHDGRHLLVVNNEYLNIPVMFGNRESGRPETADDIEKGKAAHGISVVEVSFAGSKGEGMWSIVKDSAYNRRITADTEMDIAGPAAGHVLLQTAGDPAGVSVMGTLNNCGNGRTPWGTYLSCEENFNGYFSSSDETLELSEAFRRYGIGHKDKGYGWAPHDERFDIARHPNEPNRFGYVVELDPRNPERDAEA